MVAPTKYFFGDFLSSEVACSLMASIRNIVCCFKMSPWALGSFPICVVLFPFAGDVVFPLCEPIITPHGEGTCDLCDTSHSLFVANASDEAFANIPIGGRFVEMVMFLSISLRSLAASYRDVWRG